MNYQELRELKKKTGDDFLSTLKELKFIFKASGFDIDCTRCKICFKPLELRSLKSVDLKEKIVHVKMHGCSSDGPAIDLKRFRTVFDDVDAENKYQEYIDQKIRNWKPKNCDTSSRSYFVNTYGEEEGAVRYIEKIRKMNTRSLNFYLDRGYDLDAAKNFSQIAKPRSAKKNWLKFMVKLKD